MSREDNESESEEARRAQRLLLQAREDEAALSALLEIYRKYLWTIAKSGIDHQLAAKVSPLDVVQDTLVKAHKEFASFKSTTVEELTAWLRKILLNRLSDLRSRFLDTQRRQVSREISIQDLDSRSFMDQLATNDQHEARELVAQWDEKQRIQSMIPRLPPHYRQVIVWRSLEGLPFAEVANRLGMEEKRTRALWLRAVSKLREILTSETEHQKTP